MLVLLVVVFNSIIVFEIILYNSFMIQADGCR